MQLLSTTSRVLRHQSTGQSLVSTFRMCHVDGAYRLASRESQTWRARYLAMMTQVVAQVCSLSGSHTQLEPAQEMNLNKGMLGDDLYMW